MLKWCIQEMYCRYSDETGQALMATSPADDAHCDRVGGLGTA